MGKMQIHEGWELRNVKEQEWIGRGVCEECGNFK